MFSLVEAVAATEISAGLLRCLLAISLMRVIIYGVATGQLGHRIPWDPGPRAAGAEDTPAD